MKCLFLFLITFSILPFSVSNAQDAAKGKALYASCISCHGDQGLGNATEKAPKLSGQFDWYTIKQITEIKSGVRKRSDLSPYKALMEQDIKDLAAYIVTL